MNDQPVAFITGAANGIGAATALEFVAAGYRCSLLDIDGPGLEKLATELHSTGHDVLTCVGDLGDLGFAREAVERTIQHWGRLDVLINNAAWREITTMQTITVDSWEKTLRICLTAPAFLARWCAERMDQAGKGVILNISSIQSRFPAGISPAYTAAKGGLDALTYELATLYGPAGIRVLSVNPGAIDTDLSRGYGSSSADSQLRKHVEDMIPLRRFGTSVEIAQCLLSLASNKASYLTGTTIDIDGGWSRQSTPYSIKEMFFPGKFDGKKESVES